MATEGDEIVREALRRSLKLYGLKPHLAKDRPTGLQIAREIRPAFTLLDWMMPELDRVEALAELTHTKKTEDIPAFMLTAKGMIGDLDQAFEIGLDDYIAERLDLTRLGKLAYDRWEEFPSAANVR